MNENVAIKILLVGRDVSGTGGGRVLIETALGLARRGCEVIVLADTTIPQLVGFIPVVRTWFGDALYRWRPKNKVARIVRHTLQLLCFMVLGTIKAASFKRKGYCVVNHNIEILGGDVVVLHNVFTAQAKMEERSRVRTKLRFLNPVFSMRIMRERWVLAMKRVRTVVAVSRPTLDEACHLIKGKKNRVVIHNGVDINKFRSEAMSCDAYDENLGTEIPLLFVGHEFERKGLRYLIEALCGLPQEVVLWVVGGRGSNVDEYKKYALSLNVCNRIKFLGTVNNPENLFKKCFAFVLPTSYETFGMVLLEAMACSKPVLATGVGGIVDFLDDGHNGLLIKQDANDISLKIRMLIENPELRFRIRSAATIKAAEHSWDRVSEEYLNVVRKLKK